MMLDIFLMCEVIMIHKKNFSGTKTCFNCSLNFMISAFYALEMLIKDIFNRTTLVLSVVFIITTLINITTFISFIFYFIFYT